MRVKWLLLSLGLAGMVTAFACYSSPGPVQKLTVSPKRVEKVILKNPGKLVVTKRKLVRQCVAEVNRLSYTPYRPNVGSRVPVEFEFQDSHGDVIVGLGTDGRYIMVQPASGDRFYIKQEPMSTMDALARYKMYTETLEDLWWHAKQSTWSATDRRAAEYDRSSFNRLSPGATLPKLESPHHLAELLEEIPSLSVDDLDRFRR